MRPNSTGMLNSDQMHVLTYPCNDNNRSVPYFEEFTLDKYGDKQEGVTDMQLYLKKVISMFTDANIQFDKRDYSFPELDLLPDGAYTIKEANNQSLKYNMQINTLKYWQYHKNNGITKLGLVDPESNETVYDIRTIEGALAVADLVNQAYMRTLFNDTVVISGA